MSIFRETAERLMRAGANPARIHLVTRSNYKPIMITLVATSVANVLFFCAFMLVADFRLANSSSVRMANTIREIEPKADDLARTDWQLRLSMPPQALRSLAPFATLPEGSRRATPLAPLAAEHRANIARSRFAALASVAELLESAPEQKRADVADVAIEVTNAVFDQDSRRLLKAVVRLPRRTRQALAGVDYLLPEILERVAQASGTKLQAVATFGLRPASENADVRDLMEAVPLLDAASLRALQRFRRVEPTQRAALTWILNKLGDQDPWVGRMLAAAYAGNASLRRAVEQLPQACEFMNAAACAAPDARENHVKRTTR